MCRMEGRAGVSFFTFFCQFALANSWSVRFILAIRSGSFFTMGLYNEDFLPSLMFETGLLGFVKPIFFSVQRILFISC
jgi:hypothetical protein